MDERPEPKGLSNEAIEWLVALRSGRASPAERRRFADWRSQSPEHARAFEDAECLFGLMCEAAAEEWPKVRSRHPTRAFLSRPRLLAGGAVALLIGVAVMAPRRRDHRATRPAGRAGQQSQATPAGRGE